jgi:predicted DNA-binding transcriptional regulator AlpA
MDTLTLAEISKMLRISDHTARNRMSLGMPMPPSFRVGKRRLFMKADVEKWLESQKTEPGSPAKKSAADLPTNLLGGTTMT